MDFKNMTVPDILGLQDLLQKELNLRTNDLCSTILAINEINKKAARTQNFYNKKIEDLKAKNGELKQIENMGFTISISPENGNIEIVNYQIKDRPNSLYGLQVDVEKKEIIFNENFYMELKQMAKIKEILKII